MGIRRKNSWREYREVRLTRAWVERAILQALGLADWPDLVDVHAASFGEGALGVDLRSDPAQETAAQVTVIGEACGKVRLGPVVWSDEVGVE